MNLNMLHDNVLIEALEESLNNSPIQLPESAKKKPTKGKVVAVGPGSYNNNGNLIPMTLKVGDVVFYRQWAGNEVEFSDKKYIVMKESDIIAKEV
ncbi:co-chaperonin GroES [Ehrlichia ruminantium]|uniref:Co-chaperonin GroES n=8 Tax=Ehrlichia ruminantium TaxID=779 RepID=CH10_EHRRG|nr:co-chaperone GroES [Ehrlichia ruminantium]P48224.1 RecName: Full=Co-chaperonin GroES; AltName: Full=10 kDa chaperonin; AltName: Full=Chaperonin-10; Short=Cpn10 [Ehrlichia ruminantium str. Welgevonden]Q5FFZ0.1 RecName: Full=Co-chaperonin GroES; AltName: Full=10 kDa chaperonin; AltName: Full=Chaperonin-10; Short=Cpn10 [Ehrlichia ruminantium str. Gardel]AAA93152.1 GroES homolog, similar to Rickettsia tsutsugamushi heat shock protein (10 kDa chaperonin), Swiss-Prot Accession Number P16626, and to